MKSKTPIKKAKPSSKIAVMSILIEHHERYTVAFLETVKEHGFNAVVDVKEQLFKSASKQVLKKINKYLK